MDIRHLVFTIAILISPMISLGIIMATGYPGAEWERKNPKKIGLDQQVLIQMDSLMKKANANGVLIYKGKLVDE